jgi:heme oxygenase
MGERMADGRAGTPRVTDEAAVPSERGAVTRHARPAALDLRFRLRAATQPVHARVERQLDRRGRLTSIEAYTSLLQDLLSLHRPIESALAALDPEALGIDFGARRKTGWLIADLIDLGHAPASLDRLPDCAAAPAPASTEAAFGALYVLEGSSLGGQVILRRVGPALGVGPAWAGRYFNGYGEATGAMWRVFVARLNALGADPATATAIETSALATFAAFESCLGTGHHGC